jgi:predicted membrane GTPase involved in stress response
MLYHFEGMKRIEVQEAHAGDIVGLRFRGSVHRRTICDSELRARAALHPD